MVTTPINLALYGQLYPKRSQLISVYGYLGPIVVAQFTVSSGIGVAPFDAVFTDTSYSDIASRDWDFGDGSPHGSDTVQHHTYSEIGTYVITLTVTNDYGSSDQATMQVLVIPSMPVSIIQDSIECREDITQPVKYWDYLSSFWNFLEDNDREAFENFWHAVKMAGDSLTKKARRLYDAISPENAWTCVLDDFYDIQIGYLHSRPIDLDPTRKDPNSTILPISVMVNEPSYDDNLGRVFNDSIEISANDYYAIRDVVDGAKLVVTTKSGVTKWFYVNAIKSSEEVGDRFITANSSLVGRYAIFVNGDLSYIGDEKISIYFTTGLVYDIDRSIMRLNTLQNFITGSGDTLSVGGNYFFDNHTIEFFEDPIENGTVRQDECLYCPKAPAAEEFLYSLYGNLVDIPDWIKYNTDNIAGKAAVCGLMKSIQSPEDVGSYEQAMNIYYGLPIAPEGCNVVGLYESYGYTIAYKNGNHLFLDIQPGTELSGLFQIGGRVLCPGKAELIITDLNRSSPYIRVEDASGVVVGDVVHIKLSNRYNILGLSSGIVTIASPDSNGSIQHVVDMLASDLPECLVYGTGCGKDGVYHITKAESSEGGLAELAFYQKEDGDALYNDLDIPSGITSQNGFVHMPWPTHKFLYLRLDSQRYFKAYLDAPIDTIYDIGDRLEQYDVITRSVSAISSRELPGWNEFDQLRTASGINTESDIVELVNIVPGAKFGKFLPISLTSS